MPGLVGIIGYGIPEERREELRRMTRGLMHESFYHEVTYINESIGAWLGCISHKGAFSDGMPIWNEKKDVCLLFSGEDFTEPEEIEALRARHDFPTGDASYLIHFYEEKGDHFVDKLNGRFSGIVLDLRERRALLFNDRYGLGRIYFFESGNAFYFSTEAKSLLSVSPALRTFDPRGLGEMFSCGCVLQNRTLFPGVGLMPGGSAWVFSPGQTARKGSYFRPQEWEDQERLGNAEYYDRLKRTWARLLPRYVRDKDRVGLSLTGGKDSRMILAWAQAPPGTLPCYTFGGPFHESMDIKLARKIATICRQPHQTITIGKEFFGEFPALAEKTVYMTDGAMDVSGAAELFVNRIARQTAPVRLTGNYGQEILRSSIAFKPRAIHWEILQGDFRRIVETASRTYRNEIGDHLLSFVAFKQVPWHHYSRLSVELSQITLRSPFLDNDLVALAYRAPVEPTANVELQLKLIAEGNPALGEIGTDRGILQRPEMLLTKTRHLFQQFTFKAEYAYDYGMPQWLAWLDHTLKAFRPERLFLGRHKFYHFRIWYRDELSGYVKEILLDPRTQSRPYLKGAELERMVCAHIKGTGNYTSEIHRILTTELVHRQLLDQRD